MANIIPVQKHQGMGHFYDCYGNAVEGGLRMARPCRAFPSVTTVMGIAKNYGLETYKREQFGLALLTLSRARGETDEQFIDRADEDANAHSIKAMEKGSHIHGLWENIDSIDLEKQDDLDKKRIEILRQWKSENILKVESSESVVMSKKHGFAGRFDTLAWVKDGTKDGELMLLDLKTSDPKGKKLKPWESYCMQLSAYKLALERNVSCANIMFNSTDNPEILFHRWEDADVDDAQPAFLGILSYWQWANNYWPHVG